MAEGRCCGNITAYMVFWRKYQGWGRCFRGITAYTVFCKNYLAWGKVVQGSYSLQGV